VLNVLLIDDSVVIRKMLRRVLGDPALGINEIFEAGDGSQALCVLKDSPIQVVFCDVNMPVMGGLEFLECVRDNAEWSSIPVLMVTTEGGQESVVRAVQLGAKGYIRKPFTPDEVKQKLAECVKLPAA
jgi:two-component system chemotaxis response regulator CheY